MALGISTWLYNHILAPLKRSIPDRQRKLERSATFTARVLERLMRWRKATIGEVLLVLVAFNWYFLNKMSKHGLNRMGLLNDFLKNMKRGYEVYK